MKYFIVLPAFSSFHQRVSAVRTLSVGLCHRGELGQSKMVKIEELDHSPFSLTLCMLYKLPVLMLGSCIVLHVVRLEFYT